jgi:hypothetical protein
MTDMKYSLKHISNNVIKTHGVRIDVQKLRNPGVRRTTRSFGRGFACKNSFAKASFLLVRFLWMSKENEW